MSTADTCPLCRKPMATDRDYDEIPDGEGEHLCWKAWGDCGAHEQYGSDEEMVLAAVQADRERLLAWLNASLEIEREDHGEDEFVRGIEHARRLMRQCWEEAPDGR